MSRLLLAAPPFAGHLYPLIAIAKRLRAHHAVTFATGPAQLPLLAELGFAAHPILNNDPTAFERIANTDRAVGHNPLRLVGQLRQNLAVLPQAQAELAALIDRHQIELVMADFTAPVAGWAAQRAGIAWITTTPTPFAIETHRATPSYCGGWSPPRTSLGQARDAAGRAGVRGLKTLVGKVFAAELARLGTAVYRRDGSEAVYSPERILGLGSPELEFERDWPPQLRLIGPITESPQESPAAVIAASSARRVLVTLGTHLWWAKDDLLPAVAALSARRPELEFVVTFGGRPPKGSAQVPDHPPSPRQIGERIWAYDYLAYDTALAEFSAVIHHGGAGISYSTLRAGLPALVWPHDYDQPDFAARLVHANAALRISDLDSADTAVRLDRALAGLHGVQRLQAAVQASDPFAAAEAAVQEALSTPGRSGAA